MLRKLGKRIINNFGLKILAALFAVVLWIVVVNIDEPIKTLTYTVGVTIENADYITSQDKYFEIPDGRNTVSFNVSAKRTIQEKISNSDFLATADMEKMEYDQKSSLYRVPIVISSTKFGSDLTISSKQRYLEVSLEDRGIVQKQITASTKGTVANGSALGDVKIVSSNLLKISGPSSIVNQVDTVTATIDVEGMSSEVTDKVIPVLYDAKGNVVDTTKLTLSISIVTITAQILNTKDVPVEFRVPDEFGTPEHGYMVTGIEYKPHMVRIKGEGARLNTINKIAVPAEVLDLTGAATDVKLVVDISPYLPDGISLVLNSDAKIDVSIRIEPIVEKSFEVPVENLSVENIKEGYEAKFGSDFVTVEVFGAKSIIHNLTEKDITGTIDARQRGTGDYTLQVAFHMAEKGYQPTSTVNVPVFISKLPEEAAGDAPEGKEEDDEPKEEGAGIKGNMISESRKRAE